MKASDKIYVSIGPRQSLIARAGKTLNSDIEYIRKDALLEKINEQIKTSEDLKAEGRGDVFYTAEIDAFEQTKRIIESL